MGIGEALLVLFVLHGQADYVPIREQSHAHEPTTEVIYLKTFNPIDDIFYPPKRKTAKTGREPGVANQLLWKGIRLR